MRVKVPTEKMMLFLFDALSLLLNTFALSFLWSWFIVPMGIQAIFLAECAGIILIANLLTDKYTHRTSEAEIRGIMYHSIFHPTLLFIIGAIIHTFAPN